MQTDVKIGVVIAEDEYLISLDIEAAARDAGYEVVGTATDGQEAIDLIKKSDPSVVLLDINMPRMDGLEAARQIKKNFDIPTIIMTAYESEAFLHEAKEAGVGAYLIKPPDPAALKRAVELAVSQHNEKRLLKGLLEKANSDPLTGLMNRRGFEEKYLTEMKRINRCGGLLPSLALLDLDHFKMINDTYGHASGDEVLQVFAETIKKMLRATDSICRWGGEEFAILLPETDVEQTIYLLERLRENVGRLTFKKSGAEFSVTVSSGFSRPLSETSALETVLGHADVALYEAKKAGRNRVEFFDHSGKEAPELYD